MLRRSFLVMMMVALVAQTSYGNDAEPITRGDCKAFCKTLTDKADALIQDLKDEISVHKQIEAKQTEELVNVTAMYNEKAQELASWTHNPFLLVTVGILVGGLTTAYIVHSVK